MALNNIRNEPRREWTEQLFGVGAVILYVIYGYYCVKWAMIIHPTYTQVFVESTETVRGYWKDTDQLDYWEGGDIFVTIGLLLIPWLVLPIWYGLHEIGEFTCGLMKSLGFDPRPRLRPEQQQVYNTETRTWTTKTVWVARD